MDRLIAVLRGGIALLRREWPWCLVFAAFLLALWVPTQWMLVSFWLKGDSLLGAQPLIFPGFLWLLWQRRQRLKERWTQLQNEERHTRRKRLRTHGNLSVLILGCLLILGSHFVHLTLVAFAGLYLVVIGVIYCCYGPVMLGAVRAPLAFLAFSVPWLPESGVGLLENGGGKAAISVAVGILRLLHKPVVLQGTSLFYDQTTVPLVYTIHQTGCIGLAAVLLGWLGLYRRRPGATVIWMVSIGVAVTFIAFVVRITVVTWLASSSPALSERLANLNPWLAGIPAVAIAFGVLHWLEHTRLGMLVLRLGASLQRGLNASTRPLDRAFSESAPVVGKAAGKAGSLVTIVFSPLVWVVNQLIRGVEVTFKLFGGLSGQLEKQFARIERSRRNKGKK
jgi:hypothetical protein